MKFLTVREFADKTQLHHSTIRKSIKAGKIFASRIGIGERSPYRIAESELERLHLQGMFESKQHE